MRQPTIHLYLLLGVLTDSSCKPSQPMSANKSDILAASESGREPSEYLLREQQWMALLIEARERAWLYEQELQQHHLEQGMVVNRFADGSPASVCDSLLFSSLRYIALVKLGWHKEAGRAWRGIEGAYLGGRWVRHPQCIHKTTSRDMIIGLLAALSLHPPRYRTHLESLVRIIDSTDGSIDPGPFYVSRLSPGIAELLRHQSLVAGIRMKDLPAEVRLGFSTLEWDSWWGTAGYTSHLNAIVFWLELGLAKGPQPLRTMGELWNRRLAAKDFTKTISLRNRLLGQELVEIDVENLFFVWLAAQSRGQGITLLQRIELLQALLSMPQFPRYRLPQNCDRKADYLWQRSSLEYRPVDRHCSEEFAGVDFLWMVGLLTEDVGARRPNAGRTP